MQYPVLLFDLDQTLLDTDRNAQEALRQLDLPFDFAFDHDQLAYWHRLNWEMWGQLEQKQLTQTELVNTRFSRYFDHFGIAVDGVACEQQFQGLFFAEHHLIAGAREILAALHPHHQLVVISNGSRAKQHQQLAAAHIERYFDRLFLAEELGYSKPDPHFFKTVEATLAPATPSDMLVIGDSLSADIAGAHQADLASVWFNPAHQDLPATSQPTYQIHQLTDLLPLLAAQD